MEDQERCYKAGNISEFSEKNENSKDYQGEKDILSGNSTCKVMEDCSGNCEWFRMARMKGRIKENKAKGVGGG